MDEPDTLEQITGHAGWLLKSGKHLLWNLKWRWVTLSSEGLTWHFSVPGQHKESQLYCGDLYRFGDSVAIDYRHTITKDISTSKAGRGARGGHGPPRAGAHGG